MADFASIDSNKYLTSNVSLYLVGNKKMNQFLIQTAVLHSHAQNSTNSWSSDIFHWLQINNQHLFGKT